MLARDRTFPSEPLSIKRVGSSVWILRLRESFELRAVRAVREAFREATKCEANDVVVDLSATSSVSTEGAAALAEMADRMRNRNGALWIAARRPRGDGYTLRPVKAPAPDGLVGVSPALDAALMGAQA